MDQATSRRIFWTGMIFLTTFSALYLTVFSLTHGVFDVFPFLYLLPIILFVYFYPHRGVMFSLGLSALYLLLVYY
jgi:hypothetical protein